jgi:ketosteroid isomerase-like protein
MTETADQLAEVFRTNATGDLFSDDVLFDLNMPVWRFQLRGPEAFEQFLEELNPDGLDIETGRRSATENGFVVELEDRKVEDGQVVTSRKMILCRVAAGQIDEVVVYCSGEWDENLRARHAAEAPMIQP